MPAVYEGEIVMCDNNQGQKRKEIKITKPPTKACICAGVLSYVMVPKCLMFKLTHMTI